MYFLGLGVVLLLMKFLEVPPVATWDWWVTLVPFGLAVAWWTYADKSGYTKKKAMEKMEGVKQARLAKNRDALGLGSARNSVKKTKK